MIKGSAQEEDMTIVNVYAPNTGAPQYIRPTLTDLKGETDSEAMPVGDVDTRLTPMDRRSEEKTNKETQVLNAVLDETDLIDTFRTSHPSAEEYTFFSSAHGTFSGIDHILGHKSSLIKFKKSEIVSSIFSDHNAMRLDINYKKKTVRKTNTWRLNNMFLNNQQVTGEIEREIKKFLDTNDNENTTTQNLWDAVKAKLRGNFIAVEATSRYTSNKQPNLPHKATLKRRTKPPKLAGGNTS